MSLHTKIVLMSIAALIFAGAACFYFMEMNVIFKLAPPNRFPGKTLAERQLRNRFNIKVIVVRDVIAGNVHRVPHADFATKDGEVPVIIGKGENIRR